VNNYFRNESGQEYKSISRLGEETLEICFLVAVYHIRPDTETLVARKSGERLTGVLKILKIKAQVLKSITKLFNTIMIISFSL
jgi:hypothetical protein